MDKIKKAKEIAGKYDETVTPLGNQNQIRAAHQLWGCLAMAEQNFEEALKEFKKSDQQNPYNIFRIAKAYKGLGDMESYRTALEKAANFNALNSLNYAFIRAKALKLLETK
jgi:tetratricopeptide (TPR) repeat protein